MPLETLEQPNIKGLTLEGPPPRKDYIFNPVKDVPLEVFARLRRSAERMLEGGHWLNVFDLAYPQLIVRPNAFDGSPVKEAEGRALLYLQSAIASRSSLGPMTVRALQNDNSMYSATFQQPEKIKTLFPNLLKKLHFEEIVAIERFSVALQYAGAGRRGVVDARSALKQAVRAITTYSKIDLDPLREKIPEFLEYFKDLQEEGRIHSLSEPLSRFRILFPKESRMPSLSQDDWWVLQQALQKRIQDPEDAYNAMDMAADLAILAAKEVVVDETGLHLLWPDKADKFTTTEQKLPRSLNF